jgi:hypothetical protein
MDEEIRIRRLETGSEFPKFRLGNSDIYFHGPLLQVILSQGQNAPGHPLPRLLMAFFKGFLAALQVWRGPNLIRWAQNRSFVVGLARRFVDNTTLHSWYPSHGDEAAF